MSQENVEIVRAAFEAWNRNDFDAWIQYFDPEVQWSALLEEFRGHAGIRQAWQSFKVDLQLKARFDDIRDLGEVGVRAATVLHLRDGKVTRLVVYWDRDRALEALGLSEQDAHADS